MPLAPMRDKPEQEEQDAPNKVAEESNITIVTTIRRSKARTCLVLALLLIGISIVIVALALHGSASGKATDGGGNNDDLL